MKKEKRKKKEFSFSIENMKKNESIQKIFQEIKSKSYRVDKSIYKEIQEYVTVSIPKATAHKATEKTGIEALNESILKTQAYKDRVTFILVPLLKIKSKLKLRREEAIACLWESYYDIFSQLKTESVRTAVINQIISPIIKKLEGIKVLIDSCEVVQSNLVSTGFALKDVAMLANTSMNLTKEKI